jgi:serine phosphatase RsbU (regulator of sigma subunit)
VDERFFGDDRLLDVLSPLGDAPAGLIVASVMDAVRTFAAGAPQSDDIAVLVARVLPDTGPVT